MGQSQRRKSEPEIQTANHHKCSKYGLPTNIGQNKTSFEFRKVFRNVFASLVKVAENFEHNACYWEELRGIWAQQQLIVLPPAPHLNPDLPTCAFIHLYTRILILAFLGWRAGFRACCALINHL